MTTKTKAKSRILEVVHETVGDLRRLGFIDKRKARKYEALCLPPVRDYDAGKIKALRERLHLSQTVLPTSAVPPDDRLPLTSGRHIQSRCYGCSWLFSGKVV